MTSFPTIKIYYIKSAYSPVLLIYLSHWALDQFSYCCEKIPDISSLKEERYSLAHNFRSCKSWSVGLKTGESWCRGMAGPSRWLHDGQEAGPKQMRKGSRTKLVHKVMTSLPIHIHSEGRCTNLSSQSSGQSRLGITARMTSNSKNYSSKLGEQIKQMKKEISPWREEKSKCT